MTSKKRLYYFIGLFIAILIGGGHEAYALQLQQGGGFPGETVFKVADIGRDRHAKLRISVSLDGIVIGLKELKFLDGDSIKISNQKKKDGVILKISQFRGPSEINEFKTAVALGSELEFFIFRIPTNQVNLISKRQTSIYYLLFYKKRENVTGVQVNVGDDDIPHLFYNDNMPVGANPRQLSVAIESR